MKKMIFLLFVILSAGINAQNIQKFINVNGSARLDVNADQINISVHIKTVDNSISESKKKNDDSVDKLISILNEFEVEKQDVDISPISLGKNYEYKQGERVQNGFYTSVNVSVLLKDLSKYYELIDNLSSNEAFETTNSNYSVSDFENYVKSAYKKSLIAAKEKAELMAETMGVTLGDVLEIDESTSYSGPMPLNTMVKEDYRAGDIAGKVSINRDVRVKFAIK